MDCQNSNISHKIPISVWMLIKINNDNFTEQMTAIAKILI